MHRSSESTTTKSSSAFWGSHAVKIHWPEGVGAFHAGNEVEYFKFARVGDQISVVEKIVGIEEKMGRSGKLAVVHVDSIFTNQDGDVLIINHGTNIAREMPGDWREKRGDTGS